MLIMKTILVIPACFPLPSSPPTASLIHSIYSAPYSFILMIKSVQTENYVFIMSFALLNHIFITTVCAFLSFISSSFFSSRSSQCSDQPDPPGQAWVWGRVGPCGVVSTFGGGLSSDLPLPHRTAGCARLLEVCTTAPTPRNYKCCNGYICAANMGSKWFVYSLVISPVFAHMDF